MTDDERIAYLLGEFTDGVSVHDQAELDDLRDLLGSDWMWAEPPAGLADRVVAAVTTEASAGAAAGSPSAAVTSLADRRARRTRLWVAAGIAAAVVAIGVPVGIILAPHHSSARPRFQAVLAGSALAPGASGSVTLRQTTSGWRIQLDAAGLPRLDNGAYYEAWLKNSDGTLVAIGTFNEPHGVTLWAGVPPTAFPKLTITRQTVGGGPASTGQVVLSGPITRR